MELGIKYSQKYSLNGIDPAKLSKLSMENAVIPCLLGQKCGSGCYTDLAVTILAFSTATDDVIASMKFIDYLLFWYPDISLAIFTQSGNLYKEKYEQVVFRYYSSCLSQNYQQVNSTGNVAIYNTTIEGGTAVTCQFNPDVCVISDIVFITPGFRVTTFNLPICCRGDRPNAVDNTYIISNYNPNSYKAGIEYTSINTGIPDTPVYTPIVTYEYKVGDQTSTDTKIMNFGMFLNNNYIIQPITPKAASIDLVNKSYSYVDISLGDLTCKGNTLIACFIQYFQSLYKYKEQNRIQTMYILWKPGKFNGNVPDESELSIVNGKVKLSGGGYRTLKYYCERLNTLESNTLLGLYRNFSFLDTPTNLTDQDFIGLMQHSVPIVFLGREQSISMYISSIRILDNTEIFYMIMPDAVNLAYLLGITSGKQGIRITEPDVYGNINMDAVSCCGKLSVNNLKELLINPLDDFRFVGRYLIDALLYKAKQNMLKLEYTCDTDFIKTVTEKFNIEKLMLTRGILPENETIDFGTNKLIRFDYKKYRDIFDKFTQLGNAGGFSGARVFLTNFYAKSDKENDVFVKVSKLSGGKEGRERVRGEECYVDDISNSIICNLQPNSIGQVSEVIAMFLSIGVINELITKSITPNFTFTYYIALEKLPMSYYTRKTQDDNKLIDSLIYFQENVPNSTDLGKWLNENRDPLVYQKFCQICVQIVANLLLVQRNWKMMHADLWYQNILIEKLAQPIKFNYCLYDREKPTPLYLHFTSDLLVRIIDFDTVSLEINGTRYGSASKGQNDANVYGPYRDWLWLMWTIYRPGKKFSYIDPTILAFINSQCKSIIDMPCESPNAVITDPRQNGSEVVPPQNYQTRSGLVNKWSKYILGDFIKTVTQPGMGITGSLQPLPNVKYWCT